VACPEKKIGAARQTTGLRKIRTSVSGSQISQGGGFPTTSWHFFRHFFVPISKPNFSTRLFLVVCKNNQVVGANFENQNFLISGWIL